MNVAVALSTMWAQQPRFAGEDMARFADVAAAAGYTHIEVSHSTDMTGLRALADQGVLPLSSLHAPTPRTRDAAGRWNTDLNLASEHEGERLAAVEQTLHTIDLAAEVGAEFVVLHLGSAGSSVLRGDGALRRMHHSAARTADWVQAEREQACAERMTRAPVAIVAAARSLAVLATRAEQLRVRLAIENRVWYHEIPLPEEAQSLLAEYDPALVGYWHDVGHAEILARLGLVERDRWFRLLGDRIMGCHLHDMNGIVDHRAPGTGDVEWSYVARGVTNAAVRTLEINQHEPEALLANAREHLQREGVLPGPPP